MSELENILLSQVTFCYQDREMKEGTCGASYGGAGAVIFSAGIQEPEKRLDDSRRESFNMY